MTAAPITDRFETNAIAALSQSNGCALRSTNGVREKSGAEETNNKQNRVASALSVDGLQRETQCSKKGGGLKSERGALPQKARDFHARIAAARKIPGNCGRCGKPNSNGLKQCDRCRAYSKAYKARQAKAPRSLTTLDVTALMRRVCSLEMRLAKVETELAVRRTAYRYVKRREKALNKTKQPYYQPPTMSIQEACQIGVRIHGPNGRRELPPPTNQKGQDGN